MESIWKLVEDYHYHYIIFEYKLYLDLPWSDVKFLQDVDEEVLHFIPWINGIRSIQNNNYIHVSLTPWNKQKHLQSRDYLLISLLWLMFKFCLETKHRRFQGCQFPPNQVCDGIQAFIGFKGFRNGILNSFWLLTSRKCHAQMLTMIKGESRNTTQRFPPKKGA